jgi:23S rRNA pseudouridine2605 synthase
MGQKSGGGRGRIRKGDYSKFMKNKPVRKKKKVFEKPEKKEKRFIKPKKRFQRDELIRLNKYIANAGVCSRREADDLISAGAIKVNGEIVTELGTKVKVTDKVQYGDQSLSIEKMQYILLNKPKGFITTVEDPYARRTVMSLLSGSCKERIYPVGRLDRNTTGLLLFTNDGEMAKKLTHPRYGVKKLYHVTLDRPLVKRDLQQIMEGVELDDGPIIVDSIDYVKDAGDRREVGIELHSGRNRIVRRIFESLDYKVVKLDRTMFAGLTKKNIPRGRWRKLEEKEINMLKMIS